MQVYDRCKREARPTLPDEGDGPRWGWLDFKRVIRACFPWWARPFVGGRCEVAGSLLHKAAHEMASARDAALTRLLASPDKMEADFVGKGAETVAVLLTQFYRQSGATNYVEMHLRDPQTLEMFTVTIQSVKGKTPHQFRREAEEALALLQASQPPARGA